MLKPAPRAPQGLKMLLDNRAIEPGSTVAFGGTAPHAVRQGYEAANVLHASDAEFTLVRRHWNTWFIRSKRISAGR